MILPLTFIISLAVVACVYFYLNYRSVVAKQKTIRCAIKEQKLGEEQLPELLRHAAYPNDQRKAVLLFAIAAAVLVGSFAIDCMEMGIAIAALPFTLSVAYLYLAKQNNS